MYLLQHKSEAFAKFQEFKSMVENYLNKRIKFLSSDKALEYKSRAFSDFCTLNGVQRQYSIPDTPEQNGVAERKNRTLIDAVVAMFSHSGLPHGYRGEAIHTAVYLHNRSPSKALPNDKTPHELWHEKKPDLRHLQVFRCTAFAHIEKVRSTPKAVGVFTPVTPSPGVGVPSPPSTPSVSHPPAAEVPASHPARFGQTYQRHTWKQRENALFSTPLVDSVCNLEHLLDEIQLRYTTSETPATDKASGAASSSSRTIDPIFRRGKRVRKRFKNI